MRRIGPDQLRTHGNNFNVIRLVLASCVIWSHSYGLINGLNNQDNLNFLIGRPISWLAVNGFFFVSGFLVCQSMLRQPDVLRFSLARIGRIWPGLTVCLLVTVIVFAILSNDAAGYLADHETTTFLIRNTLQFKGQYALPDPWSGTDSIVVNGSLWTITWELRCYVVLALFFLISRQSRPRMAIILALASVLACSAWIVAREFLPYLQDLDSTFEFYSGVWSRLWGCFAAGMLASIWWRHIPMVPLMIVVLWVLAVAEYQLAGTSFLTSPATFYTVLVAAFWQRAKTVWSANWPDFSYGTYIYAFPIMVVVHHFWSMRSYALLALVVLVVTIGFAVASWFLVERPALTAVKHWSRSRPAPAMS